MYISNNDDNGLLAACSQVCFVNKSQADVHVFSDPVALVHIMLDVCLRQKYEYVIQSKLHVTIIIYIAAIVSPAYEMGFFKSSIH